MRLVNCKITNYKRLKNVNINLDRSLIAIVGPNESGKSSFFDALQNLENSSPIPINHITRGEEYNELEKIVRVEYVLEDSDYQVLRLFSGLGQPRFYYLEKEAKGKLWHGLTETVERDKSQRLKVAHLLKDITTNKTLTNFFSGSSRTDDDEDQDQIISLISDQILDLESTLETLKPDSIERIKLLNSRLQTILKDPHIKHRKVSQKLQEQVGILEIVESSEHPREMFLKFLDQNRPHFRFFGSAERLINETYETKSIVDLPPSFINLLNVAEINPIALQHAIDSGNFGDREKIIENGNSNLLNKFSKSWNQANVYPKLSIGDKEIRILIRYLDTYTTVGERSDGLKQFISLFTFIASRDEAVKPILLIDEAEIHLHYAAQADLIEMFEKQSLATSILYSTHSAGCLPSDLGTGIRVFQPMKKTDPVEDLGITVVTNSIWESNGGFSPLLLAMGANIIAFAITRKAIIAEGPSETILLPRILREALGINSLTFQVAPGIATISTNQAIELELEAIKVAFLVDGDIAGKQITKKLKKGRIKSTKIISLPKDHTLEDFVSAKMLIDATNEELRRSNNKSLVVSVTELPRKSRITYLRSLCADQGITFPSKVKIANHIVSLPAETLIFDELKRKTLINLHSKLISALE